MEERECLLTLLNYSSQREFMTTVFGETAPVSVTGFYPTPCLAHKLERAAAARCKIARPAKRGLSRVGPPLSQADVPAAYVAGAISINFVNAGRLSLMHEDNLEGMRRHYEVSQVS